VRGRSDDGSFGIGRAEAGRRERPFQKSVHGMEQSIELEFMSASRMLCDKYRNFSSTEWQISPLALLTCLRRPSFAQHLRHHSVFDMLP
jgi:hypothetical protein